MYDKYLEDILQNIFKRIGWLSYKWHAFHFIGLIFAFHLQLIPWFLD